MQPTETFEIKSKDGLSLYVEALSGQSASKKVLLIVHGYSEHGSRYRHLPEYLGQSFKTFYAVDLRGHGRSAGRRGDCDRFEQFVEDLECVIEALQKREPGAEWVLLGHSFGGLVSLSYLLQKKKVIFSCAIFSAPLLDLSMRVPPVKLAFAKLLLRTFPHLQLSDEVNPAHLSHDLSILESFVNDRLVHNKVTPQMFFQMSGAMQNVREHTGPLPCPSLFLVAGHDRVVSSGATLAFYRNLKSRDKQLREYPDFFHEILNETHKEKAFNDIKEWLTECTQKSKTQALNA